MIAGGFPDHSVAVDLAAACSLPHHPDLDIRHIPRFGIVFHGENLGDIEKERFLFLVASKRTVLSLPPDTVGQAAFTFGASALG